VTQVDNRKALIAACARMQRAIRDYRAPHQVMDGLIDAAMPPKLQGWQQGRLCISLDIMSEQLLIISHTLKSMETE
jgi:hypothetical protein